MHQRPAGQTCKRVLDSHEGAVASLVVAQGELDSIETKWPGLPEPLISRPQESESAEDCPRRHVLELRKLAKESPMQLS